MTFGFGGDVYGNPYINKSSQIIDSVHDSNPRVVQSSQPLSAIYGDFGTTVPPAEPKVFGPLLTAREAADLLRVKRVTIYRMVERGDLPHVRISNAIRIPARAIKSLCKAKKQR